MTEASNAALVVASLIAPREVRLTSHFAAALGVSLLDLATVARSFGGKLWIHEAVR